MSSAFTDASASTAARPWSKQLCLAVLLSSCHSADGSSGGRAEIFPSTVDSVPASTIAAAQSVPVDRGTNARRRAWPVPPPGRGLTFLAAAVPSSGPATTAGRAALDATADRCPDHAECERIANNASDAAHYGCSAQCDACCPHPSVEDCVRRECRGALERCRGKTCTSDLGEDLWMQACNDRCRAEMSSCSGCRNAWCGQGSALGECHADADSTHRESLRACVRDCPPAQRRADGTCTITCGIAKTTCSRRPTDCQNGQSPDCRCECVKAAAGICLAWKDVCTCD